MTQNQFKVTHKKSWVVIFLVLFFFCEPMFMLEFFMGKNIVLFGIMSVLLFILCFFAIFIILLFRIKVDGTNIKVRTGRGKKYEFDCSDISFVNCFKSTNGDHGPQYNIKIITKSNKLEINHETKGFEQMAEYLLVKHESGDIRSIAVSERSKEWLHMYKNRDIYNRKKMKEYLMRKKSS